ncbi:hypothetical protein PsorP6_001139 [Peronosclerospora sorghi]|uniref:Uncharacterized protein n=1 Tax=Peronosclerospora sorghi TaxID=230839 RepID=A0ACC0WX61_9STRA|nr:hypothetical protein PsorP6_001139 [Peronosclerospora sorghi]
MALLQQYGAYFHKLRRSGTIIAVWNDDLHYYDQFNPIILHDEILTKVDVLVGTYTYFKDDKFHKVTNVVNEPRGGLRALPSYCGTVASVARHFPPPALTVTAASLSLCVPTVPRSTERTMKSTRASVQGPDRSHCVTERVCVQQISTGDCPDPQEGLPLFGSDCDLLQTGAYGCKPYMVTDIPTNVTYKASSNCSNNPAGDTP